ncbi:P-loop NTPase [Spirochaetia bacterium 38H-sp]|uniref:P-loop NTPase n=1 Tax=Rarispira pelagica TaxID=3141764 RepID=A0ABU9U8P4_9SPIR
MRVLAVASGKGGVGKSTTALNLALWYVRRGFRVGLVDLDPLANIHVILDIPLSSLESYRHVSDGYGLEDVLFSYMPRFDILYPVLERKVSDSRRIYDDLFIRFLPELERRYDFLIMDFPPGISQDETLIFLPAIRDVLVVSTGEPTSHVSTGGYLRALFDVNPYARPFLWLNRFKPVIEPGFVPDAVISTYNRFAPDELRILPDEAKRIVTLARVPYDPSLDLLSAELSVSFALDARLFEAVSVVKNQVLSLWSDSLSLPASVKALWIRAIEDGFSSDVDGFLSSFSSSLEAIVSVDSFAVFSASLDKCRLFLKNLLSNSLWCILCEVSDGLKKRMNKHDFAVFDSSIASSSRIHKLLVRLLAAMRPYCRKNPFLNNLAGLLVFSFALHMLGDNPTVERFIMDFVPSKRGEDGRLHRNRSAQIRYLIEKDEAYHNSYVRLVSRLFPLFMAQLHRLADKYKLKDFIFCEKDGSVKRASYLKLLSAFLHDTLHSGLGVFFGFKYNAAGEEIRRGANVLLSFLADANRVSAP